MRVLSVGEEFTKCQFLSSPDTLEFKNSKLRTLTLNERKPISISPNFSDLIAKRNIVVATIPTKKAKKKRELSLNQKIAKANSNEEVQLLLKEAGLLS